MEDIITDKLDQFYLSLPTLTPPGQIYFIVFLVQKNLFQFENIVVIMPYSYFNNESFSIITCLLTAVLFPPFNM